MMIIMINEHHQAECCGHCGRLTNNNHASNDIAEFFRHQIHPANHPSLAAWPRSPKVPHSSLANHHWLLVKSPWIDWFNRRFSEKHVTKHHHHRSWHHRIWLVVSTCSYQYDFVSWDDEFPTIYYWKITVMFQSPPTRYQPSLSMINHYQLLLSNHY